MKTEGLKMHGIQGVLNRIDNRSWRRGTVYKYELLIVEHVSQNVRHRFHEVGLEHWKRYP